MTLTINFIHYKDFMPITYNYDSFSNDYELHFAHNVYTFSVHQKWVLNFTIIHIYFHLIVVAFLLPIISSMMFVALDKLANTLVVEVGAQLGVNHFSCKLSKTARLFNDCPKVMV